MSMSKKHYEQIAAAIKIEYQIKEGCYKPELAEGIAFATRRLAQRLAVIMQRDNAAFDRARFLAACSIGE